MRANFGSNLGKFWKIDPSTYQILHFIRGHSYTERLILLPMLAAHPRRVVCTENPTIHDMIHVEDLKLNLIIIFHFSDSLVWETRPQPTIGVPDPFLLPCCLTRPVWRWRRFGNVAQLYPETLSFSASSKIVVSLVWAIVSWSSE